MSRTLLLTRLRWRREQSLSRGGVNWESIRRGEPTALLPHTSPHKEVPGQQRRITTGGVENGTSCPAQKGYGQLRPSNGIHTCTFAFLFLKKKLLILGDRGHCFGVAYANPFAFAFLPLPLPPTKTTAMLAGSATVLNALARALSLLCDSFRAVGPSLSYSQHNLPYHFCFQARIEGITQIKDWRIDDKLGEGSFGLVVRGVSMRTGQVSYFIS